MIKRAAKRSTFDKGALRPRLDERVLTSSFRTWQKFGAASSVRKIKITEELRAKYEKKQ